MAETEIPMTEADNPQSAPPDQPLLDATPYCYGKDDSVVDPTENAAITQHTATLGGRTISYTARAGPSCNDRSIYCAARCKNILRRIHRKRRAIKSPRYLFLQWRPRIVVGLSSPRIVRTAANKDQHALFYAACSLCTGAQCGLSARPHRSGVHQSGRHSLLVGNCSSKKQRLLGSG
jgi:hypothetical protein